jgi:colanic acid/amylovoran biosynthesis glycosyltransferase
VSNDAANPGGGHKHPRPRIGYLIPEYPSQTHAFFAREMNALRGCGFEVVPISTIPPKEICRHEFAQTAREETIYLSRIRPPVFVHNLLRFGIRAVKHCLRKGPEERLDLKMAMPAGIMAVQLAGVIRRNRIQHVHCQSFARAGLVAAIACEITGTPFSLTLHGDLPVYGSYHRRKAEHASFLLAVTEPLRQSLIDGLGFPAERAFTLTMGVDTSHFTPLHDRPPNDPPVVITVSRLNRAKGHQFLLEALARIRDAGVRFHYKIVGLGPYEAEIREVVDRLGLNEHVTFTGTLSETEVLEALRAADVFVLPSVGKGEAAPVSVMEAMSCGIPVIVSRIGGTPWMIAHGQDGFLTDQGAVDQIESALRRLLSDPTLRGEIGTAARRRANQDFDARVLGVRLSELLTRHR